MGIVQNPGSAAKNGQNGHANGHVNRIAKILKPVNGKPHAVKAAKAKQAKAAKAKRAAKKRERENINIVAEHAREEFTAVYDERCNRIEGILNDGPYHGLVTFTLDAIPEIDGPKAVRPTIIADLLVNIRLDGDDRQLTAALIMALQNVASIIRGYVGRLNEATEDDKALLDELPTIAEWLEKRFQTLNVFERTALQVCMPNPKKEPEKGKSVAAFVAETRADLDAIEGKLPK